MGEQRIDRHLSPCTTVNTPSGKPASFQRSAAHRRPRVLLGRLQHQVLPAASAIGKNHIGTMAGKLNRR